MKTKYLIFAWLFIGNSFIHAQENGYSEPSPTQYTFNQAALEITQGCTTKREQAKAIYRWLCDNISYDTDYGVYTADECIEQRRGVCQAYCELFYRIAEPLGIETRIISGRTKKAQPDSRGHSWLYVIVNDDGSGIFIDPTWGAGSVDNGIFVRSNGDMTWFDVSPEWLIFTHFPKNPSHQMLPVAITRQQFDALPEIKPFMQYYGFDGAALLQRCLDGDTDLPQAYNKCTEYLTLTEMPLSGTLHIGNKYVFEVKKLKPCTLAIINEKDWYYNWYEQEDKSRIEFVPTKASTTKLSAKIDDGETYITALQYHVAEPTAEDLAKLEEYDPILMPEVSCLKNYSSKMLHHYGIDGRRLLQDVRAGKIKSLPLFYNTLGPCHLKDVPLNGKLQIGKTYTFVIQPGFGLEWAISNEGKWFQNWRKSSTTNTQVITVTPINRGKLDLGVKIKPGKRFNYILEYEVE